jgi:hypothetical protein
MRVPLTDSISDLLFPATTAPAASAQPSEVECQVLRLFEQFRNPLLLYVVSFGVPVHEAEEITQWTRFFQFPPPTRAAAQRDIATDWIAAYKKYFHTDRPLAVRSELFPFVHVSG